MACRFVVKQIETVSISFQSRCPDGAAGHGKAATARVRPLGTKMPAARLPPFSKQRVEG